MRGPGERVHRVSSGGWEWAPSTGRWYLGVGRKTLCVDGGEMWFRPSEHWSARGSWALDPSADRPFRVPG
jgi:hypothetical protein